jgi:quercetin dioxygenase-like cupin family protein
MSDQQSSRGSDAEFFAPYVRSIDLAAAAALPVSERFSAGLIERDEPFNFDIRYIRTPPGGGSPRGPHTRKWDQVFYLLEGVMEIEILGRHTQLSAGQGVLFPHGVEHRNWNASDEPTVHLAINVLPEGQS